MTHKKYIPEWETAMRCGLMGGRPFSEPCVKTYLLYVNWFIERYEEVSTDNVRAVFLAVPVEHFAKRLKIYESIRSFARYLIDLDKLDPHFLDQVKRFKPKRHIPPRKITVDEANIQKLLTACETPLDKITVELLSQTGLRVTEACQLALEDIQLESGFLTVKRGKWGKSRRVGLTQRVQNAIENYLSFRPNSQSSRFLVNSSGNPVSRHGINSRLEKLGQKTGVKVSPHALRRSFVTINANKGYPLPILQIACGHSDITTTRSYCMTTEDETIQAMQGWT